MSRWTNGARLVSVPGSNGGVPLLPLRGPGGTLAPELILHFDVFGDVFGKGGNNFGNSGVPPLPLRGPGDTLAPELIFIKRRNGGVPLLPLRGPGGTLTPEPIFHFG